MNVKVIPTEDACIEQWRMLTKFSYEANIQRFWENRYSPNPDTLSFISGSIRQAHAYFSAGALAPMDIAPLLFYYGFTNLLWGVGALLNGEKLPIKKHGMRLIAPDISASNTPSYKLSDWKVRPCQWLEGGLHLLANVFSVGCNFPQPQNTDDGTADWHLGELFGSLPDLRDDVITCYGPDESYTVPIETTRRNGLHFERIYLEDLNPGASSEEKFRAFALIESYKKAYLMPQSSDGSSVVLKPKLGGINIGIYSLFGQKYLSVGHIKSEKLVCPSPVVIILMALYALGYLSRYHPEEWHKFVRNDESGERMIVERFLSLVNRYAPNLVLNQVQQQRIVFATGNDNQNNSNLISNWDESELKSFVREQAYEIIQKRENQ